MAQSFRACLPNSVVYVPRIVPSAAKGYSADVVQEVSDPCGAISAKGENQSRGMAPSVDQYASRGLRNTQDPTEMWVLATKIAYIANAASPSRLMGFAPRFLRPLPPPLPPLTVEQTDVLPLISNSLLWDDAGEVSPNCIKTLERILVDAQCRPLQPAQDKYFLLALVRFWLQNSRLRA
jgi:hypothetical protein